MSNRVIVIDRGWNHFKMSVEKLASMQNTVKIGFFGDPKAVKKAMYNEFGSPMETGTHSPARPFFRRAIDENAEKHVQAAARAENLVLTKGIPSAVALQAVGEIVKKDIQMSIFSADRWAEPLKSSTVRRKGHDIVLYETGELAGSVDVAVLDGRPKDQVAI